MQTPNIRINRRYLWAQQLTAQILHIVAPHIDEKNGSYRQVVRELEELFLVRGVQVITEHDRAAAGLPPRDAYGWTIEELRILEARMLEAMLKPLVVESPLSRMDPSSVPGAPPETY